jgi:hypothetical protein
MRAITMAACLLAFTTAAMAAETATKAAPVPAAKAATKATTSAVKKKSRGPAAHKAAKAPALEKLTCRTGPNDEQVRLIVEAVKGRAMEFAFYSRLGTRVCSISGRRGDAYTKWEDAEGNIGKAVIKLRSGSAVLEYLPGHVKMQFTAVDRMPYCGMYGELNGSVEAIAKKPECGMQDLFEGSGEPGEKQPSSGD